MFYSFFACEFFEYGVFLTNAFRTSGLWHVCELPTMGSVLFVFTPVMLRLTLVMSLYLRGSLVVSHLLLHSLLSRPPLALAYACGQVWHSLPLCGSATRVKKKNNGNKQTNLKQ